LDLRGHRDKIDADLFIASDKIKLRGSKENSLFTIQQEARK
jgi:hypothetical protein